MDIGYWFRTAAARHTDVVAVRSATGQLRFGELRDRVARLAHALLGQGLRPGDRVLVLLGNRLEYPEVDLAIVSAGLVRVALNPRLQARDYALMAEDSAATTIVTEASFDQVVDELRGTVPLTCWIRMGETDAPAGAMAYEQLLAASSPVEPPGPASDADTAWISYTSGTTGRPKGVVLSHRALVAVARNLMAGLPGPAGGGVLLPQPLSHGAGYFVLPQLVAGGTVRVMDRFDAEEVGWIAEREGIATFKCVPDMLATMVRAGTRAPFASMVYGAAPIPGPLLDEAQDRYGPVLTQIYGQSEAPVTITVLGPADHARPGPHRRSAGRPWPFVAVEVVDAEGRPVAPGELGEVRVRSPHQMTGYHGRPDLTAEVVRDGWVWTKDMATTDDEGFVHLQGRRDDMINSGGFNIAPREVEDVLTSHPSVRDAAVIGVDDDRWGQVVKAFLVARDGHEVDAGAIEAFTKPLLGFRRPRYVEVLADLPRNTYGKVDVRQLRQLAAEADR